jgi:hypothetical protein
LHHQDQALPRLMRSVLVQQVVEVHEQRLDVIDFLDVLSCHQHGIWVEGESGEADRGTYLLGI